MRLPDRSPDLGACCTGWVQCAAGHRLCKLCGRLLLGAHEAPERMSAGCPRGSKGPGVLSHHVGSMTCWTLPAECLISGGSVTDFAAIFGLSRCRAFGLSRCGADAAQSHASAHQGCRRHRAFQWGSSLECQPRPECKKMTLSGPEQAKKSTPKETPRKRTTKEASQQHSHLPW